MLGKALGQYEILEPLGAGGMGEVYRARDTMLDRDVAIKILPPSLADSPARLARLVREAKLLAALNHPHIATIYNFEEYAGTRFLVLELIEGETLQGRLTEGALPVEEALEVCSQVAEALEAAHSRGIIHRDLKPANVLVTRDGRAKVLDFGLAKSLKADPNGLDSAKATSLTNADTVMGTPSYMGPEQMRGEAVDEQADIWAFGCLLYETLAGQRAFAGPSNADIFSAVLNDEPDWSRLPRDTPELVAAMLRRCLQKDRARRLHDITEARALLNDVIHGNEHTGGNRRAARRSIPVAIFATIVIASLLAWAFWPPSLLGFEERDWLLIADFQHPDEEADLARALATALDVGLQESAYVNVVSQPRIASVLQLMQLPEDTPITEQVGLEVSQRAGLRGLLVPELTVVGSEYLLTLRLIAPGTGSVVTSFAERAEETGLLDALDVLVERLRSGLGESKEVLANDTMPLRMVTTASLEALKLFSAGELAWDERRYEDGVALFEEAIEIDPEFAYAQAALGNAYSSFILRKNDEGRAAYQEALARLDRVGPRERHFIQAMYHSSLGQQADAVQYYELHLDRYPDDLQARSNLGNVYRRNGDCVRALDQYAEVLRLDPENAATLVSMATCAAIDREYGSALGYYDRAFDLRPSWRGEGNLNHEYGITLLMTGQFAEATAIYEERVAHANAGERAAGRRSLGQLQQFRGQFDAAAEQFSLAVALHEAADSGPSAARDRVYWARGETARGETARAGALLDEAIAQAPLQSGWIWLHARIGGAYLDAGRTQDAAEIADRLSSWSVDAQETSEDRFERILLEAAVANARGAPDVARELIEPERAVLQDPNAFLLVVLADAAERTERWDDLAQLLSEVIETQWVSNEGLVDWVLAHYEFGRLLERLERPAEAVGYYTRFIELWGDADSPLPELERARRRLDAVEAMAPSPSRN